MYEITITRVFSAAHTLRLYDGSQEPIHGHNWDVHVTVGAGELDQMEVVLDFHQLEQIVDRSISQVHNQFLNQIEPFASGVNPTAERVAQWLAEQIAKPLSKNTRLLSVQVTEAAGCIATYRPD